MMMSSWRCSCRGCWHPRTLRLHPGRYQWVGSAIITLCYIAKKHQQLGKQLLTAVSTKKTFFFTKEVALVSQFFSPDSVSYRGLLLLNDWVSGVYAAVSEPLPGRRNERTSPGLSEHLHISVVSPQPQERVRVDIKTCNNDMVCKPKAQDVNWLQVSSPIRSPVEASDPPGMGESADAIPQDWRSLFYSSSLPRSNPKILNHFWVKQCCFDVLVFWLRLERSSLSKCQSVRKLVAPEAFWRSFNCQPTRDNEKK